MDDIRIRTGKRLKQLMEEKQLTARFLGWDSETDPSHIYAIFRGEVNVSMERIENICQALEISISEFFNSELFN